MIAGVLDSLTPYGVAILSVFLSSTGQVLFKLLMRHRPFSLALLNHPLLYLGFLAYGVSALLWLWVLSKLSLVVAYPIISLNFVLIGLAGTLLLHEKMDWNIILGTVLILSGIVAIAAL